MKKLLVGILAAALLGAGAAWAQPSGGVSQLLAGSGVALSPSNGIGRVTVSVAGSGGVVNSVTGTANQVTASPTTGDVIVSLPVSVVGVNSFTSASGNNSLTVASTGTGNVTVTPGTSGKILAGGNLTFTAGGTITAPSATNLTLNGGSSGASLALGQGADGSVTLTPVGLGWGRSAKTFQVIGSNSPSSGEGVEIQMLSSVGRVYAWDRGAANTARPLALQSPGGNVLIGGTTDITGSGGLKVFGTTASTSTTTGSLINAGGFGNAGAAFFGGDVTGTGLIANTPTIKVLGSNTASQTAIQAGTNFADGGSVGARIVMIDAGTGGKRWQLDSGGHATGTLTLRNDTDSISTINFGPASASSWTTTGQIMAVSGGTFTNTSTAGSGTAASAVFSSFAVPTLAATNTSVTTTNAATVYIAGAPTAGTNQTISNSYSQWNAAASRFDKYTAFSGEQPGTGMYISANATSDEAYIAQNWFITGSGGTATVPVVRSSWRWRFGNGGTTTASLDWRASGSGATAFSPFLTVAATSGDVSVASTTASTSTSTGAFIVANKFAVGGANGNFYAAGDGNITGNLTVSGSNAAIGGAIATARGLVVAPTGLTSAVQYGVSSTPVFTSAATASAYSLFAQTSTAAASFTLGSGYGLYVQSPSVGAASAITSQRGIFIVNQGAAGITNAYGIDIQAQSGAATTNIGLRNAGLTSLTDTTEATTGGAGSLTTSGGIYATKAIINGSTTDSTSTTTGAVVTAGGAAVAKNLTVGGLIKYSGGLKAVTSSFTKSADTSLADITGLSVTVSSAVTYHFKIHLNLAADVTGGYKVGFGGTATVTSGRYSNLTLNDDTNAVADVFTETNFANSAAGSGASAYVFDDDGIVVINAGGTFTATFAQTSASGSSSVLTGSYMELTAL